MIQYRAVIFDLDGTLVNSLSDIANAMNMVLAESGLPVHSKEAYKYFVGNGIRELVSRCLPESHRTESNIEHFLANMLTHYRSQLTIKSCLYKGISQLLDALSGRDISMSILSNKADHLTQQIVSQLLGRWKFEYVQGASEQFPRKPDPASALFIAKGMGMEPDKVIYMGDTGIDMDTATAAGFMPVGVSWGFRQSDELLAHGAKYIIDEPMQLFDIFDF